ncbi:MAG: S1C family serine protease [Clostridia bacterium]|nr:S1C family serine protease [Clostridia bacterium]
MKKFFAVIAATFLFATVLFCGCSLPFTNGVDGRDGKDGTNASVYDYYEFAKTIPGNENMTKEEFLEKYLGYSSSEIEEALNLQASINRSMRSAVAIAAQFNGGGISLGSGVIVDLDKEKGDAYVLTNCHVVYNDAAYGSHYAGTVYLYLYGQDTDYNDETNRFNATVIGASITYDVALLKVTGSELLKNSVAEAAEFATDDDIYLGEQVYTVGNAEGYGISVTRGIVSRDREVIPINMSELNSGSSRYLRYYTVMRTDAAINEGNSGGALFNGEGKIVALVNSKSSDSEDANGFMIDDVDGMSYAIPASTVKRLYPLMKESYENNGFNSSNPKLSRAHFVVKEDFTKSVIDAGNYTKNLEVTATGSAATWNSEKNVLVFNEKVSVLKDCYGLKAGDLITHIKITNGENVVEDRPVDRLYHLQDTLLSAREGYSIEITVKRGGETVTVPTQITFSQFD